MLPLIALLLLIAVFCAGIGLSQTANIQGFTDALRRVRGEQPAQGMSRSTPTRISIPSLGVRADIVEVGRAADGSIATPKENPVETTGWYGLGPTPGERGTSVIVGHVDTQKRAAVFEKLAEIRKGKLIEVKREDRRVATFTVDSIERFPKTAFPADRVFAVADRPQLVLVTCGGQFLGGDIGYADNVIVFASLV